MVADAAMEIEQSPVVGARDQIPVDGPLGEGLAREGQGIEVVLFVEPEAGLEALGLELF